MCGATCGAMILINKTMFVSFLLCAIKAALELAHHTYWISLATNMKIYTLCIHVHETVLRILQTRNNGNSNSNDSTDVASDIEMDNTDEEEDISRVHHLITVLLTLLPERSFVRSVADASSSMKKLNQLLIKHSPLSRLVEAATCANTLVTNHTLDGENRGGVCLRTGALCLDTEIKNTPGPGESCTTFKNGTLWCKIGDSSYYTGIYAKPVTSFSWKEYCKARAADLRHSTGNVDPLGLNVHADGPGAVGLKHNVSASAMSTSEILIQASATAHEDLEKNEPGLSKYMLQICAGPGRSSHHQKDTKMHDTLNANVPIRVLNKAPVGLACGLANAGELDKPISVKFVCRYLLCKLVAVLHERGNTYSNKTGRDFFVFSPWNAMRQIAMPEVQSTDRDICRQRQFDFTLQGTDILKLAHRSVGSALLEYVGRRRDEPAYKKLYKAICKEYAIIAPVTSKNVELFLFFKFVMMLCY